MTHRSENGIVAIAGGSAGIGRAAAQLFADRGFDVAVMARNADRLDQTRFDIESRGVRCQTVICDVANNDEVEAAATEIEARLGPISIWVNCAMLTSFSPFEKMLPEEFDRIGHVTFNGQVNGTRAALRRMRPRNRGAIVNVGSGLAYRPVPLQSAYCAAKHAINGFTSAVRSELIHDGVDVSLSLVQLPAVKTPQFDWARNRMDERPQPAPPVYQPEVAAKAIVRAAESGERELLVGRSVVRLVFGDMIAPGLLDRQMAQAGYDAQASGENAIVSRDDNLFASVDRPVGASGRFGERASDEGLVINADHARAIGLAGLLLGAAALGWVGYRAMAGMRGIGE